MALTGSSWGRVREIIRKRDKETCVYCGESCPNGHVDHILPLSKGGSDNLENLAWGCQRCNLEKHDKSPREWIMKARGDTSLPPLPLPSWPGSFDLLAAGWDCDCNGYGYQYRDQDSWLPEFEEYNEYSYYCNRHSHGHHHPDCPILDRPKGANYDPYFSKLVNGEPYLFQVFCDLGLSTEEQQSRSMDFWHKKYGHYLDLDSQVRRCSEKHHDRFRAHLRSNEFNIRLKMKRLLAKAKELEQEPSHRVAKTWLGIVKNKLVDWGLIRASKKTA